MLAGEVLPPVVASVLAGVALGVVCVLAMFGPLAPQLVTGQSGPPQVVVPWWAAVAAAVPVGAAVLVALRETASLQRRALAGLLREG